MSGARNRFEVGDVVTRPGSTMTGVVICVTPMPGHSGSSDARVQVRWENGFVFSLASQQILKVA